MSWTKEGEQFETTNQEKTFISHWIIWIRDWKNERFISQFNVEAEKKKNMRFLYNPAPTTNISEKHKAKESFKCIGTFTHAPLLSH